MQALQLRQVLGQRLPDRMAVDALARADQVRGERRLGLRSGPPCPRPAAAAPTSVEGSSRQASPAAMKARSAPGLARLVGCLDVCRSSSGTCSATPEGHGQGSFLSAQIVLYGASGSAKTPSSTARALRVAGTEAQDHGRFGRRRRFLQRDLPFDTIGA